MSTVMNKLRRKRREAARSRRHSQLRHRLLMLQAKLLGIDPCSMRLYRDSWRSRVRATAISRHITMNEARRQLAEQGRSQLTWQHTLEGIVSSVESFLEESYRAQR